MDELVGWATLVGVVLVGATTTPLDGDNVWFRLPAAETGVDDDDDDADVVELDEVAALVLLVAVALLTSNALYWSNELLFMSREEV